MVRDNETRYSKSEIEPQGKSCKEPYNFTVFKDCCNKNVENKTNFSMTSGPLLTSMKHLCGYIMMIGLGTEWWPVMCCGFLAGKQHSDKRTIDCPTHGFKREL